MQQRVYLDHAASSVLVPQAKEAMAGAWDTTGNPHSLHASGRTARRLLEEAREDIADALGAAPGEIVFTASGTEANNLALLGGLAGHRALNPRRRRLVISAVEHPSVDAIRARSPEAVDTLPTSSDGAVAGDALAAIDESVALVSVMAVNNETGVVQPLPAIVAAARQAGSWVHSDAVQAPGHVPLSFADADLDALSVSAHKVGGPVGIGALVVRRGLPLTPLGFGGGQERKLRSGTVPFVLAVGFAAALRAAVANLDAEAARLAGLRGRLVRGLQALPDVRVNGAGRLSPAILNATFAGTRADDLLLLLDAAGVDASTGSACSAGVHQPSHVLLAMGRTLAEASASLRFSFGPSTTAADIDALLAVLPDALAKARAAFH